MPKNVFRLIYTNNSSIDSWNSGTQTFDLKNIGKMYFDKEEKRGLDFSSPNDLYHLGSTGIVNIFEDNHNVGNELTPTIESWLSWFNN